VSKPKIKVGRLLGTAASFIPGIGPYVGAAEALGLFGGGGSGGQGPARTANQGFAVANPFIRNLEGRLPEFDQVFSLLPDAAMGLQQRAAGIDDFALLEEFQEDAINRLLPRMVESAASGPLASAVGRGVSTSSSLAGNIIARATQDATERLLSEVMQRKLAIPNEQIARDAAVMDALGQMAGLLDPSGRLAALLPSITQGGLGAAELGMQNQANRASGITQLLSGLNPKKDFSVFSDWLRGGKKKSGSVNVRGFRVPASR